MRKTYKIMIKAEAALIRLLPDFMTGKRDDIERILETRYGSREISQKINEQKLRIAGKYIIVIVAGVIAVLAMCADVAYKETTLNYIERPVPGGESVRIPVDVTIEGTEGEKDEIRQQGTVNVRPRAYTEEEKERMLTDFMDGLDTRILGENGSADSVSSDLELITRDEETGICLRWESDNPDVISEDGKVNVSYVTDSAITVYLSVFASIGSLCSDREIEISVVRDEAFVEQGIKRQIESMILELSKSDDGIEMMLPDKLKTGAELTWKTNAKANYAIAAMFVIIACALVCMTATSGLASENKKYLDSIKKDFPAFIDKLILLLNAGMVVSTAMKKIAGDYENGRSGGRKCSLYEEVSAIQNDFDESNTSLILMWKTFGKRTGLNEVMRFCAILEDNVNKGSSLAEKLEAEGEMLRRSRRKDAEEKGRAAETKMTLPMMMSLMALVLITIAPSMMEM